MSDADTSSGADADADATRESSSSSSSSSPAPLVVVRFTRQADGATQVRRGRLVDEGLVECKPPGFGTLPSVVEGEHALSTAVTVEVSVNAGHQYSEPRELTTIDYKPE